jgi:hypothetical protein
MKRLAMFCISLFLIFIAVNVFASECLFGNIGGKYSLTHNGRGLVIETVQADESSECLLRNIGAKYSLTQNGGSLVVESHRADESSECFLENICGKYSLTHNGRGLVVETPRYDDLPISIPKGDK